MPMRIVLLGFQKAGKSSAGDTILDKRHNYSRKGLESVVRQGQASGRQLTVVEAPGWLVGLSEDSIELLKQEILCSPALCPPGPHAFLIVIPVNISFTDAHRTSVVKHLELLGAKVWRYAMVLFTAGDYLGNRTIEYYIECEGSAIQWLLKKCSDRYHVLNNKYTADGTQVTELLEKIQEMVDGNEDCHYDIDINILEAEKRKKDIRERATERKTKIQNKRKEIREQMGHTEKTSELSSAANFILGKKEFDWKRSAELLADRSLWSKEITESCELLQQEIILSTSLCPPGAHAILLTVRADVAFQEADRSLIEQHVELLGEKVWSHIIVLFTSGNYLGDMDIELHIESEGKALHWLLEKCKNRYHFLNTESRDAAIQVQDLLDKVEEMVTENSHCLYEMDREILKDAEERKRNAKTRAHQRKQEVQQHREHISPVAATSSSTGCAGGSTVGKGAGIRFNSLEDEALTKGPKIWNTQILRTVFSAIVSPLQAGDSERDMPETQNSVAVIASSLTGLRLSTDIC
ncbi:hypothetical protein M9458_050353 [Cirrhinus mrigala]|uniref:AIG1-type G domain-containing protein n=1 Tax=Cirrhinus mrigala TaxID=683832 RepID=A0ABD0MYU1_CIRMR